MPLFIVVCENFWGIVILCHLNFNVSPPEPNPNIKISFEKGTGATNVNLALVAADSTKAVLMKDFASVSLSNDLKWVSGLPNDNSASLTTNCDITVGGVPITVAGGKGGITAGTGKIYFDGASKKMTMNGATVGGQIVSNLDELTIEFIGTNSAYYISSTNTNAPLTITSGTGTNTLSLASGSYDISAVNGFASVTLDGAYLKTDHGTSYVSGNTRAYKQTPGIDQYSYIAYNIEFTTVHYYPLWLNGTIQVYEGIKDDIYEDGQSTIRASFAPGSNTLTMNGLSIDSDFGIESGLSSLTINLIGENSINTNTAYHYNPIYSHVATAPLVIQKAEGAASAELQLSSSSNDPQVIKGFASVTHTGLNFSSKTGSTISDASTKDAILTSATIYPLLVGGNIVTETRTSGTGWSYDNNNKKLSLNAATLDGPILSGLGNLTIDIQGENTITVSDSAAVIRSTNAGKLTITKTGATPSLRLQNTFSDNYPNYHCPVIKDFASFELSEGLYLSNAKSDGDFGVPALYDSFGNLSSNGGNSTLGLVNAAQSYGWQPRGIKDVTISTDVCYPIWVAHHRASVGNGYNIVYTQITADNKGDFLGDGVPKVSFIPASADNENVNTLKLNGAAITDAIFSSLANLTIEFSGANTLCDDGGTEGYIHGADPNAIITFKALADNSSISLDCANDHAVVEGFANVAFDKAVAVYYDNFSYNTTERKYKNNYGALSTLVIKSPTSPTMGYNDQEKVTLQKDYPDGDIYYTITYADGKTANVAKTKYTEEFAMAAPGTVEAWVEANGSTTATIKGKHFGYKDAPFIMDPGETKTPVLIPAIENGDNIDYAASDPYISADPGIATFAGGVITAVSSGDVNLTTSLTTTGASVTTVILNSNNQFNTVVKVSTDISGIFQGQNQYGTYYNAADNYTIPAGMEAYIITGVSNNQVVLKSLSVLPKQMPLLLYKGTATTFYSVTTDETDDASNNKLKYADPVVATTGKEFVLYNDEFVMATGDIPVGRCYLDLNGVSFTRGAYGIGDGTTAIKGITLSEGEEAWYDLQGRRIERPTKPGLYIRNGKKVVVNNK